MKRMFYKEALAYIHDAGFLGFSRRAAPHVLRRLERRCEPSATVVEIGCGSGGLTKALTKAGYRVLGVDVSSAMIFSSNFRSALLKFAFSSRSGRCFNVRRNDCSRRQLAILAWLPESRISGTPQPRNSGGRV